MSPRLLADKKLDIRTGRCASGVVCCRYIQAELLYSGDALPDLVVAVVLFRQVDGLLFRLKEVTCGLLSTSDQRAPVSGSRASLPRSVAAGSADYATLLTQSLMVSVLVAQSIACKGQQ